MMMIIFLVGREGWAIFWGMKCLHLAFRLCIAVFSEQQLVKTKDLDSRKHLLIYLAAFAVQK